MPSAPPLPDSVPSPRPHSSSPSYSEGMSRLSQTLPPGLPLSPFRGGSGAATPRTPGDGGSAYGGAGTPPGGPPRGGSQTPTQDPGSFEASFARKISLFAEAPAAALPSAPPLDPSLACAEWPSELTAAALSGFRPPFSSQPASSAPSTTGGRRPSLVFGGDSPASASGRWVGGEEPRADGSRSSSFAPSPEPSPTGAYHSRGRRSQDGSSGDSRNLSYLDVIVCCRARDMVGKLPQGIYICGSCWGRQD